MGAWYFYKCEKCGFELIAPPSYFDLLMSGYLLMMRCRKCRGVSGYSVNDDLLSPGSILSRQELTEFGRNFDGTSCNCCGAQQQLEPWAPECGCPMCGGKLVEQPGVLMVD